MRTSLYLFGILCLGLFIRLIYLFTPTVDSDQAVFGLMAMHILKGEFPLIQWGFPYMSSGESFFAVPFFLIFGPTPFSLNLSVAVQSLGFIVLVYFFAKRIWNPSVGLLAALYAAVAPHYLVIHCVLARGAYIETLILGTLALWMSLRIFYPNQERDRGWLSYFLLGLAFGLGLWFHFLIVFFMAPIGLFFLLKAKTLFKKEFLYLIVGFCAGSAPFWIHNFLHDFESFVYLFKREENEISKFWEGFRIFFTEGVPIILGIFDRNKMPYFSGSMIFLVIYGLFMLYLIWSWLKNFKWRTLNQVSLILAFLLFYVLILSKSQFIQSGTQRYFIPLFAGLPLLWAFPLYRLIKRSKLLGVTLLSAFMIFHFFVYYNEAIVFHPKKLKLYQSRQKGEADLLRFLENNNMKHVYYHDYWLGFRLNFMALEKITFVQSQNERYEPYQRKLESTENPVFIDRSGELFDPVFKMIGGSCRSVRVNRFSVYHDFQEPARQYRQIGPEGIKAEASIGSEDLQGLFDRNARTSWNSGKPKSSGMWVKFDLGKTITLGMLRLWSRPIHFNNYAMDASIDVSLDGQNWISVIPRTKSDYYYWSGPRIYYWELSYRWEARFLPMQARYIRIHQYENEPLHAWIIGEAYFYEDLGKRALRQESHYEAQAGSIQNSMNSQTSLGTGAPALESGGTHGRQSVELQGEEEILKAVIDLGLERVYADRWINAKLREKSGGRVETYRPVTRSASPINRVIEWGPKVGFILEDSDADQFEAMMQDEEIHLIRRKFGRWELFYFSSWGEREEALRQDQSYLWLGIGAVCGNPRLRSQHLERLGEKSQRAGQLEEAVKYYQESLTFYKNNQSVRRKLAALLESIGHNDQAEKHRKVLNEQIEPEYPRWIEFEKGVEFIGYRLDPNEIKPGQTRKIIYYWRLNREIKKMLGVFIHIEGMGKLFHGDHQFLIQDRDWIPPLLKDEIFQQECLLEIPKDTPTGEYEIRIGLFDLKTGSRLKVKKTKLEHQERRVLIGSFEIKS